MQIGYFSILQRENEVSLRSRLLTFFLSGTAWFSFFFDRAKDFLSVPAIQKTSTIQFINDNFLKNFANTGFYGGHNYKRAPYSLSSYLSRLLFLSPWAHRHVAFECVTSSMVWLCECADTTGVLWVFNWLWSIRKSALQVAYHCAGCPRLHSKQFSTTISKKRRK